MLVLPGLFGPALLAYRTLHVHLFPALSVHFLGPGADECDCVACSGGFSRAYLRHLFIAGEMLGPILISLHNNF